MFISEMPLRPHVFFRPENQDAFFVSWLPRAEPPPFDGAVLPAKYIAPYPDLAAGDPNALPDALASKAIAMLIDPATPELALPSVRKHANRRLIESRIGQALPLPLDVQLLVNDEGARNFLVDETLAATQRGDAMAPPYLEYQRRDQGELGANLAMYERALRSAGAKRVVAFIQATESAFRAGLLPPLAPHYERAGVDHVFLRVRGLRNEEMDTDAFAVYLDVISAFRGAGLRVTIDCCGRAGPPLVAGGASGFTSGWRHFRHVAKQPFGNGGGGSERSRYEVFGDFSDVPLEEALRLVAACPVSSCQAHLRMREQLWNLHLRLHFLHVLRMEADLAAEMGAAGYADRLARLNSHAAVWAVALRERAQLIA
jgi:hypothetical protein